MAKDMIYSTIAEFYDLLDLPFEHFRYRPIRRVLWQGLSGRVLDAGMGTGRNIAHYPNDAEMVGIDLSPAMLKRAHRRRIHAGREVEIHERDVCDTGFGGGEFDVVVSSFLFCVLPDNLQLTALQELARICRKGGEIRILEYVYSRKPIRRFIMNLWAPWVAFAYGARFDRDTAQYAEAAGLELVEDRFVHGDIIRLFVLKPT